MADQKSAKSNIDPFYLERAINALGLYEENLEITLNLTERKPMRRPVAY